jgi:hypothetical protein
MPRDFAAKQVRTTQLIASGGLGIAGKMHLGVLVYSGNKESDSAGTYPSIMLDGVGEDAFMFVSGAIGKKAGTDGGVVIFGGDMLTSGAMYFDERSAPSAVADGTIALYGKDDAGVTKLYFQNENGEVEIGVGGSGGAPTTAEYVTMALNGNLTAERVLTPGDGIAIDTSVASVVTVDVDIDAATDGSGITIVGSDKILLADADDANNVYKVTISQIPVGSPAGSSGQVQYNDSTTFAGADNLTFDGTDITIGASDSTAKLNFGDTGTYIYQPSDSNLKVVSDGPIVLESSNTVTVDALVDIALSADGGNVTMDDGTTTVFDFDVDNVVFKMMDDTDTNDYFSIGIATNGATTITTVDSEGGQDRADLTLTVDGKIDTDSPVTGSAGLHIDHDLASLQIGATPDLILSASGAGDAIIANPTNDKDIIFRTVKSTVDTSMIRIDGSAARVGINVADSDTITATLHVSASAGSATVKVGGQVPKIYLESDGEHSMPGGYLYFSKVTEGTAANQAQFSYLSGTTAKQVDDTTTSRGAQLLLYEQEPGADFAIMNRKLTAADPATYALNLPFYISASATDPSGDMVLILSGGTSLDTYDPRASIDINFFVSGSKGSMGDLDGKGIRGTAVFGGDVVISGSLSASYGIKAEAGGTDKQIQFNDSAELAGASDFYWDKTLSKLGLGTSIPEAKMELSTADSSTSTTFLITTHADNSGSIAFRKGTNTSGAALVLDIEENLGIVNSGSDKDILFKITDDSTEKEMLRFYGTEGMVLFLSGGNGQSYEPKDFADTNFWVSGSINSKDSADTRGTAVFGGDIVVSGTLYAEKMVVEVDETVDGTLLVSGSLEVKRGMIINTAGESAVEYDTRIQSDNYPYAFFVDSSADRVLVLSGGHKLSPNEASGSDINFYVSGAAGSKGVDDAKGTTLFGGDVTISGSLYGPGKQLLILSGGDADSLNPTGFTDVNFFVSGSSKLAHRGTDDTYSTALFGGNLYVSGNAWVEGARVYIAESLMHLGDGDTRLRFTDDVITMSAAGITLVTMDGTTPEVVVNDGADATVDFRVETGNKPYAVLADASTDQVLILSGGTTKDPVHGHATAYADTNFFVSGTIGSRNSSDTKGTAVFGGDMVVSGTLYADKMVVEIDESVTGSLSVSGSLFVSRSAHIYEGLSVNTEGYGAVGPQVENDTRIASANFTHAFFVDTNEDRVLILSGGDKLSDNEASGSNINFYISGAMGSRERGNPGVPGTVYKGTSLFGGDLVVSGGLGVRSTSTSIVSNDSAANAIYLHADGGTSETIKIHADQGNTAASIALVSDDGGLDLDAGTLVTIDAATTVSVKGASGASFGDDTGTWEFDGAGAISTTGATTVDIDGSGVVSINSSTAAINVGNDTIAQNINIGSGASARTIQIGNAASIAVNVDALAVTLTSVNALQATDGTATIELDGSGATSISGGTTTDLDGSAAVSINSTGGAINIGDDDDDQAINIGTQGERTVSISTGAFASTVNIGNETGATALDLDAGTGGVAIDSQGAGTIAIGTETDTGAINIGVGASARMITIGADASTKVDVNALAIELDSAATIVLNSTTTTDVDSTGILSLNSAAAINVGNDDDDQAINIGTQGERTVSISTGAFSSTLALGNATGTTAVTIDAGTGGIDIDCNGATGALQLDTAGGDIEIGVNAAAGDISIGTDATARTITVGNVIGATAIAVNAGTGGIAMASTGVGDITIDSDDTLLLDADGVLELNSSAGVISIGNDANAQNINVGTGAAARTIAIGNATGTTTIDIDAGTGGVDIDVTSGTGNIALDTAGGDIEIGVNAAAGDMNIGTNATARTITIGNATGTTALVLTSGTGDIVADSVDAVTIDAGGVLELNSDGGAINIGNDADAQAINIGTGAAARTITVGELTTVTEVQVDALLVDINAGAGGITMDAAGASNLATSVGDLDVSAAAELDLDGATVKFDSAGQMDITAVAALNTISAAYDVDASGVVGIDSDSTMTLGGSAIDIDADGGKLELDGSGGIDIGVAADVAIDIDSSTLSIDSSDDVTNAIYLHADGGTSETIKIHADQGTTAGSIELDSDAGGITLISGATTGVDAVTITASQTTKDVLQITADSVTEGSVIDITADALTSGKGIVLASTSNNLNAAALLDVNASGTSTDAYTVAKITKDAANLSDSNAIVGLDIDFDGTAGTAGRALRIDSEQTTGTVVEIDATEITTGTAIAIDVGDARSTGMGLSITDAATNDSAGSLVKIAQTGDRAGSAASIGLDIDFDTAANASARAFKIDSEQTTGIVAEINGDAITTGTVIDVSADTLTTGKILNLVSDSSNTDANTLALIHNDNTAAVATTILHVKNDAIAANNTVVIETTAAETNPLLELRSSNAATDKPVILSLNRTDTSAEADDMSLGVIRFDGVDAGDVATSYVTVTGSVSDITAGDEGGKLTFNVFAGGTAWGETAAARNLFSIGGEDVANATECEVAVNDAGIECNFRVESDDKTHAIFVNAATDQVLILSGGAKLSSDESTGNDVNFYVSGTIASKGTSTRGTSYFGGDTVVKGRSYVEKTLTVDEGAFITGSIWCGNTFTMLPVGSDPHLTVEPTSGHILIRELQTDKDIIFNVTQNGGLGYAENKEVMRLNGSGPHSSKQPNVGIGQWGDSISAPGQPAATLDILMTSSNPAGDLDDVMDYHLALRGDVGESAAMAFLTDGWIGGWGVGAAIVYENNGGTYNRGELFFGNKQTNSQYIAPQEMLRFSKDGQFLVMSGVDLDVYGADNAQSPDPRDFPDTNFWVSGTMGSKGSSTLGTAVFGGDLVTSGTVYAETGISGSLTQLTDGTSYLIAGDNMVITTGSSGAVTIASTGGGGGAGTGVGWFAPSDGIISTTGSLYFGVTVGTTNPDITFGSDGAAVFNEQGGSVDFRVESSNYAHMLFVDAGNDRLGIGSTGASPATTVHIKDSAPTLRIQRSANANDSSIEFAGSAGAIGSVIHLSSSNDLVFKTHNGSSTEEILRLGSHYGSSNRQVILLSGSAVAASSMQPKQSADINFFVSGTIGSRNSSDTKGTAVFGGDLVISGTTHTKTFLPLTDNTYDLGSASKRYANIYTGDLHLQNERGNWTVIEEENYLVLRNNKSGKRFKIMMELLPDDD